MIVTVGMVTVLGIAIAYGMAQRRKKRLDPVRDEATRRLYREDDRSE